MNKRGISQVVTTLLIILLSIVAVSVLWGCCGCEEKSWLKENL